MIEPTVEKDMESDGENISEDRREPPGSQPNPHIRVRGPMLNHIQGFSLTIFHRKNGETKFTRCMHGLLSNCLI